LDAKELVWVDRAGRVNPLTAPAKPYDNPRLAPDGKRIAVVIREDENHDIWLYEIDRGVLSRVTFGPGENETPAWAPDGLNVLFSANRSGASRLLLTGVEGGKEDELLGTTGGHRHAYAVSPAGDVLLFQEYGEITGSDIWTMSLHGDRTPQPLLQTMFNEGGAQFSPDGRWVAYASDESGRSEIYVRSLPATNRRWQVSAAGGDEPMWSRNQRELFYRAGDQLMAVAVMPRADSFTVGQPRMLFSGKYDTLPWASNYDVAPDGQRFLMVRSAQQGANGNQIDVVVNWFEELKRLVPAK